MKIRSNIIKNISEIGIADISGAIISSIFWFYLASIIPVDKYGELIYLISIAQLASGISLFGATNTLLVYSAKKIPIQSTLYVITFSIGVICSLIVLLFVQDFFTSILVIGYLIFGLAYSDLLGKKFFKTYFKFIVIHKIITVTSAIIFYSMIGESGIILGLVIGNFLGIFQVFRGFRETTINFKIIKEKFRFVISNFVHTLTSVSNGEIDKLIIAPFLGFTLLGNYALSLQFLAILGVLPTIISKYLIPNDSSGIENKNLKKFIILISCLISILGFFVGPEIISTFFEKFSNAGTILRIVSISIIPTTVTTILQSKFLSNEKSHYLIFTGIVRFSCFIICLILFVTWFNSDGIGYAILISAIVEMFSNIILYKKLI